MKRGKTALNESLQIFEKKVKNLLFLGVKWYKLSNGLTWPEIGAILREKGHNYSSDKLRAIDHNWAADRLIYFSRMYNALGLPDITPELAVKWDKEIREMEAAEKERLRQNREKREAAKAKKQAI